MKTQFLFALLLFSLSSFAQVGIGTASPNASSQLDVSSTTKGFLPPRMTLAQRNAIPNPVPGLVIWCSDCEEMQVYSGKLWKSMSGKAASGISEPNITICNQVWSLENLSVVTYNNGDPIPEVSDPVAWQNLTTGAWCWYQNDSATYAATYGRIYNWYAVVDPRGLAPIGWHIPSDDEWLAVIACLGNELVAGGKMKAVSPLWDPPNIAATNSSGFTGLPAGGRNGSDGLFGAVNFLGFWWASTEFDATDAWFSELKNNDAGVYRSHAPKADGVSVRCIKD
jgi:uncharacterized protein (TIGR02145 family)